MCIDGPLIAGPSAHLGNGFIEMEAFDLGTLKEGRCSIP